MNPGALYESRGITPGCLVKDNDPTAYYKIKIFLYENEQRDGVPHKVFECYDIGIVCAVSDEGTVLILCNSGLGWVHVRYIEAVS
jgi:hypothetical protein